MQLPALLLLSSNKSAVICCLSLPHGVETLHDAVHACSSVLEFFVVLARRIISRKLKRPLLNCNLLELPASQKHLAIILLQSSSPDSELQDSLYY
jgi:hypothetical protein